MKRGLALLMVCIGILAAAAQAPAVTRGVRAATRPIVAHIEAVFPEARARFINCPAYNTAPLSDGSEGLGCEFRIVVHNATVRGNASVASDGDRWAVLGFHTDRPNPHRWKRCGLHRLRGLPSSMPRLLLVYGEPCLDARMMASTIQFRANTASNLRIPRHFTEAWYGTNTLGFVTNTFHCRGRVQVRDGAVNPYGHETARCRNRFGDRFVYTFDQGS